MATFLYRFAGKPSAPLGSASFTDVVKGKFYDKPIGWLVKEGLTTGTSPGKFSPDRTLTRGEMATFLYRFSGDLRCADL
ncbi:MAG: S-layer homology domain-containing protein [Acidimicrobiales bacterium]